MLAALASLGQYSVILKAENINGLAFVQHGGGMTILRD